MKTALTVACTVVEIDTEFGGRNPIGAVLTNQHAASSQGLPVIVLDGEAKGPADLGPHVLEIHDIEDPACDAERDAYWAAKGGFVLDVLDPGPAPRFISRENEREMARRAGYTVSKA